LTIGRDVYNSLSLQDAEVSRSHAIVFEQGDETHIKDLNSRNGVFVNGDKVTEQLVHDGDEIILGSSILFLNPPEGMDVERTLSRRGRQLFERRVARTGRRQVEPVTVFTCEQMDRVVHKLFNETDSTTYFSLTDATALLKTLYEMGHARESSALFRVTLERAMELLRADHAVIMESDLGREKLKVRALRTRDGENDSVEIAQQVLRVVLRAGRCVFCPNVAADSRFSKVAEKCKRPIHSFVAAPVAFGSDYYGFIYLDTEDPKREYGFVALRSLYLVATHLGALLHPRETHFVHETPAEAAMT
jgi:hypothetical protein